MKPLLNNSLLSEYQLRYLTLDHDQIILIDETFSNNTINQTKTVVDPSGINTVLSTLSPEIQPHVDILKHKEYLSEAMVNNQLVFGDVRGKKSRNGVYKSAVELGMEAVSNYELALVNALYSTVVALNKVV